MARRPESALFIILLLILNTLSGCIFSPSFGEGSSGEPVSEDMGMMDANMDMTPSPEDMSPPPSDMAGDDGVPDDAGVPQDLGVVPCTDDSQCQGGVTRCDMNKGECVECPEGTDAYSCMGAGDAPQCGVVRPATQCSPEPVVCECDEEGTRCPGDPSQIELTPCEKSSLCPPDTKIDMACNSMMACRDVQRMCPSQERIETFTCEEARQVRCTLAARPTPGMAREKRHVAMGLDDVVVSHGTADFPDFYVRQDEGKWSIVRGVNVPVTAFKNAMNQWAATYINGSVDMVSWQQHGLALAMGDEKDPYMASTARVSYMMGDGSTGEVDVVIVLRKTSSAWTYVDTIFPVFDDRNGFGHKLAIQGNQLLVGSRYGGLGKLSMYKIEPDQAGDVISAEFDCNVMLDKSMSVALTTLASQTVLLSSCEGGACACPQQGGSARVTRLDATVESLAAVDDKLLTREEDTTSLYQLSHSAGIVAAAKLYEYKSSSDDRSKTVRFERGAQGAEADVVRIMLTAEREVHTTPGGHTVLTGQQIPISPFDNYLRYAPVLDEPDFVIADADINARGETVMVVQQDHKGIIFFASPN